MSVAAIILAAGRGTRFGREPKMLALLDGKPLVRHVAEGAVASTLDPVIVVTGHDAEAIEAALADLPVRTVFNPAFVDGLSTSLNAGFAALPIGAEAALVLLGDMPLIGARLMDLLAQAWVGEGGPAALIPVMNGQRGNPVVLSRTLAPDIAALKGDAGAGPLLRGREDVCEWPVEERAVLQDVDTAEALAALRP